MSEKTVPETQITKRFGENQPVATRESSRYLIPTVDIFETDNGLTLLVDMPGVKRDNIDVRVADGILTIRGSVAPGRSDKPVYREYELLDYFRQFELSDEVDHDHFGAELKNGVLTLTLPKSEKTKARKIEVNAK